ncbi:MAG TPA: 30S ribosomal protein S24e [archaeon]|nr:30S ribosomal protein S24e [archaeon]
MKLEVIKRQKNPELHREEINLEVLETKTTPNINQVAEKLAALNNVDRKLVAVDRILSSFGSTKFNAYAKIYESEELKNKIENPYVLRKNKKEEKEEKKESKE